MRVIIHCFVRNGWVSFEKKAQGVTQGTTSMQGGTPDDEGIYVAQPVGDDAPQAGPFEPDFAPAVSVEVISQSPLTMHFAGVGTKMLLQRRARHSLLFPSNRTSLKTLLHSRTSIDHHTRPWPVVARYLPNRLPFLFQKKISAP
jgi:hypothetical protein